MKTFDLMKLEPEGKEDKGTEVFFQNEMFKTRVIVLEAGGKIPPCDMDMFVMFYVVKGEVLVKKNEESTVLKENQVFISEPAVLSMESVSGARIMGVQVKTG